MNKLYQLMSVSWVLISICSSCTTSIKTFPTKKSTNIGVKMGLREGTIFTAEYAPRILDLPGIDIKKRFTPSKEDVEETERILREQVIGVGKSHRNHYPKYPVNKNLNSYFMQYLGFTTAKGEKIIHVNFLRNKGTSKYKLNFDDDYETMFGGGDDYWQLDINLTTQQVIDLRVNGTI